MVGEDQLEDLEGMERLRPNPWPWVAAGAALGLLAFAIAGGSRRVARERDIREARQLMGLEAMRESRGIVHFASAVRERKARAARRRSPA